MASSRIDVRCSSERFKSKSGCPPKKRMIEKSSIHPGKVVNGGVPAFADRACSNSFWRQMECYFTSVTSQEESYLSHQLDFADMATTEAPSLHQILISAMIETDESKEMNFQSEENNDFLCAIDDSHSVDQISENDIGSVDDKIRMQLQSLDLCHEHAEEEDAINKDIFELEGELVKQAHKKKRYIKKIYDSIQQGKHAEKRKLEQTAMDKLMEMAFKKQRVSHINHSSKTALCRVSEQIALPFAERTLAKCREFEETERSCFGDVALESSADAPESVPSADAPASIPMEPTNAATDSPHMQDQDWQGLDIPMDNLWDVHFLSWL
ncbi:uncharacterized protein LOC141695023 isoform X2 [Apium graveolens]|uniref:uncharacterized protein LOC141695023 isoform X2 n=1 Tax=Apium graveolens TaxID=4045 RepID=UPI003D7B18B5